MRTFNLGPLAITWGDPRPERYEAQVFDGEEMVYYAPNRATRDEARHDASLLIDAPYWADKQVRIRVRNTRTGAFLA